VLFGCPASKVASLQLAQPVALARGRWHALWIQIS
jgi:hypothetical protein